MNCYKQKNYSYSDPTYHTDVAASCLQFKYTTFNYCKVPSCSPVPSQTICKKQNLDALNSSKGGDSTQGLIDIPLSIIRVVFQSNCCSQYTARKPSENAFPMLVPSSQSYGNLQWYMYLNGSSVLGALGCLHAQLFVGPLWRAPRDIMCTLCTPPWRCPLVHSPTSPLVVIRCLGRLKSDTCVRTKSIYNESIDF